MIGEFSERMKGRDADKERTHWYGADSLDWGVNLFLLEEKKQIEDQPLASNYKEASCWEQFRWPEVMNFFFFSMGS